MSVRATKMNTFIGNQREAIAAPDGDIHLLAFPRSWPFILFFKYNLLIFKTGPNFVSHASLELESVRTQLPGCQDYRCTPLPSPDLDF